MSAPAFTMDDVLAIHSAATVKFGGIDGVRDEGLLESALAQPFQTFGGKDLYPGTVGKACRYAFGIIRNHPFIDGNKRTAAALLGAYLRMSGVGFRPDHGSFLKTMMGVADGTLDYQDLLSWVEGEIGFENHSS